MGQTQSLAIPRVIPDDWKRLDLIINKIKFKLGSSGTPTFASITITGLTASALIGTDADNALESVTIGTGLAYAGATLSLSHLGIEDLTDPDADRIMFWDESAPNACKWLVPNTLISITGTNLNVDNDLHNYSWANVDATDLKVGSVTQAHDVVLDDLSALAVVADNEFIVGDGAGSYAHESGATVRTSLGLTIGTNVQAWDAQLDDIAALAVTDGNFIVGDGTNWVAESGATVRTSLGLGTGDSPQFTGIELGHADDTTITRVGAGVIAVEGVTVMLVGGAPAAHSIASHNDTTGTGAELDALTDGSDVGALHSHAAAYQPLDAVLTDLAALSAVADNQFIVGDGAGSYAHENAATAATSMGLGTGDSPTFLNLTVTNAFSITDLLATGDTQLGNNVALDNVGINVTPVADTLIKGSFASTGSGATFCYNDELFTHTEDDSTASTYIYGTNSVMSVNDDLTVDGIFVAVGHKQFLEASLTTITGVGDPVAYLYGYHAVVDWAAAALGAASYAACVVGFKADVTGNLGTVGNTIKWGADISVSESAVTNYGGRFTAQGATYNYGIWGYTTGAHTTNYGLYGSAQGATTNWGLYVAAGNAFFAGNLVIPNGGTIGQAAGPLLTFDDTNNRFKITGIDDAVIGDDSSAPWHFGSGTLAVYGVTEDTTISLGLQHVASDARCSIVAQCGVTSTGAYFSCRAHGPTWSETLFGLSMADTAVMIGGPVATGFIIGTYTNFPLIFGTNNIVKMRIPTTGGIVLKEQATAGADIAAFGQDWVKNTSPCTRWFTDDAGNDGQFMLMKSKTINSDSDAADVHGCNVLWVDTSGGDVVLGGLANGVDNQLLYVFKYGEAGILTIEHQEGTGTQKFMLNTADLTYNGIGICLPFICKGGTWYIAAYPRSFAA